MEIRDNNRKVKRGMLLGSIILVALTAVGYFSFFYPPSGKHLAGTIAPAARYRAEQIGKSDVKVAETDITRWTQTAEFDHLSKDPASRKLFANAAFRNALANDAFRNALNNNAFREALSSNAFREALSNNAFREALNNNAFRKALSSNALREALNNNAF